MSAPSFSSLPQGEIADSDDTNIDIGVLPPHAVTENVSSVPCRVAPGRQPHRVAGCDDAPSPPRCTPMHAPRGEPGAPPPGCGASIRATEP